MLPSVISQITCKITKIFWAQTGEKYLTNPEIKEAIKSWPFSFVLDSRFPTATKAPPGPATIDAFLGKIRIGLSGVAKHLQTN